MNIKMKNDYSKEKKLLIKIIIVFLIIVFCGAVGYFIGKPMIQFVSKPESFRDWVESKGVWSRFIFVGMMIFQVIIAFIPGEPLEIGAGYAFGAVEGCLLCLVGTVLGSLAVFLLVRRFGVKFVALFFDIEKIRNLKFLKDQKRLEYLTFLAFFLPGTPKDLLTYAMGLTEIKLSVFMVITSVARLPSIITSTVGGGALSGQRYVFAIAVFAVTVVISVAGIFLYNKFVNSKSKK